VLRRVAFLTLAGLLVSQAGCVVFKRDYDQVVASAAQAKAAADAKDRDQTARIQDLQTRLSAAEAGMQDRDGKIGDLSTGVHNMQAQLDEATAINQELRAALERLGKDADKLLAERGTLSRALDDARIRLEELRRAQAAAEARVALFKDLEQRFAALEQAGQLRVETRRGHLVMDLTGDLLFDANHAELRAAGKGVLMEIARAIQTTSPPATTRRFLVTAHVDDEPLKNKHFRSVWELTAERGAVIVDYLVSLGVPPGALEAAGAGSFDPLVPNDSADDRARNRRVEIALLPADAAGPAAPVTAPAQTAPAVPAPPAAPGPAPAPSPRADGR
jgi:chemotaxis protein MotB